MNNKRIGTEFERAVCERLRLDGWWVHFITPDASGAQPFDIIAVRGRNPIAIDCKTCAGSRFPIGRLEDNQINAFDKWSRCGNGTPMIFVEHQGIKVIPYNFLTAIRSVKLDTAMTYEEFNDTWGDLL